MSVIDELVNTICKGLALFQSECSGQNALTPSFAKSLSIHFDIVSNKEKKRPKVSVKQEPLNCFFAAPVAKEFNECGGFLG